MENYGTSGTTKETPEIIAVTPEIMRELRAMYRSTKAETADLIREALKTPDDNRPTITSRIKMLAFFLQHSSNLIRDRKMLKDIFGLNIEDLKHLNAIDTAAPFLCPGIKCALEDAPDKDLYLPTLEPDQLVLVQLKPACKPRNGSPAKATEAQQKETVLAVANGNPIQRAMYVSVKNSFVSYDNLTEAKTIVSKRQGVKLSIYEHPAKDLSEQRQGKLSTVRNISEEQFSANLAKWSSSTKKVLAFTIGQLLKQNPHFTKEDLEQKKLAASEIKFSVSKYMSLCNVPETKESKEQFKRGLIEDLKVLYHTGIEEVYQAKGKTAYSASRLVGNAYVQMNDEISLEFTQAVARFILHSCVGYLPYSWFAIDDRNSNTLPIAYKLSELFYNSRNINTNRNNIVSVKALLAVCDLPSVEDARQKCNRKYKDVIITPLVKSLNKLAELEPGFAWEFCREKKDALLPEARPDSNIRDFLASYITYTMPAPPQGKNGKESQDITIQGDLLENQPPTKAGRRSKKIQ